jgi:esterase/lipase superfamily enzyme
VGLAAHGGLDALRAAKRSARLSVQFGDARLDVAGRPGLALETGLAQVSIPPHHVVGEVERPSVWRGDLFEDPQAHMVVHGIVPQAEDAWFATLRDVVAGSDAQDAFVFVHGYNVTFEEALLRGAIAYDLKPRARRSASPAFAGRVASTRWTRRTSAGRRPTSSGSSWR